MNDRNQILGLPTQVLYTKNGLLNADNTVQAGSTFSIKIDSTVFGQYINLADTELNFSLVIPTVVADNYNAWLPNYSVLDIMSVENVQIDGINLNLSKQFDSDMFFNAIRYNVGKGNDSDRKLGYYSTDLKQEFTQAANLGGEKQFVARPAASTRYLLGDDPVKYIYSTENARKLKQLSRQYTVSPAGVVSNLANLDSPLNHYSVKLGQLCPQLKSMSLIDTSKLLSKGGLVITIRLLEIDYCMSGFLMPAVATTTADIVLLELQERKQYYISNCYLGVVQHTAIPQSLQPKPTSFLSYYGFGESLVQTTYNRLFSIPNKCLLRGLVIQYHHESKLLIKPAVNGSSNLIPEKNEWFTEQAAFTTGARNFSTYTAVNEMSVTMNGSRYPKSSSAAPQSALFMQAQQFSQEIFGQPYSVSFEEFMTTRFAQFIPINERVDGSSNIQIQIQFTNVQTNKRVHILAICDRVLNYQDGRVTVE